MSATARPQQVLGAEAELARDYERLKPELLRTVRSRLAAGGVQPDDADLEGFYNQAWHALYVKLVDGEPIESRNGLLVSIMHRRAIDDLRARRPAAHGDPDALEQESVEPDLAREIDDRVRVAHLIEGFRERLADRELQAAMLCYVHDYSRGEAAERLGIRPKRMKKLMDDVAKKVGELVDDLDGGDWCDSRRSLVKAYALGLLDRDGQRYALASDHLRNCSACRHRVLAIRGLAGLAPPLPVLAAALPAAAPSADAPRWRPRRPDAARRVASKATALATGTVLVAAIGTLAATRGGDDPAPSEPRPQPAGAASAPSAPAAAESRLARQASRARKAKPRKRPRRRPPARRAAATPTPASTPAATATPAPVATAPPAATPAPAAPPPPPAATAPPPRQPPARDGWEEFELN